MSKKSKAPKNREVNTDSMVDDEFVELDVADLFTTEGPSRSLRKSLVTLSKKSSGDTARQQVFHVWQSLRAEGATEEQAMEYIYKHLPAYYGVGGKERKRDLRRSTRDGEETYLKITDHGHKYREVDFESLGDLDRMARTPLIKSDDGLISELAPSIKGDSSSGKLKKKVVKGLNELRAMMGDKLEVDDRTTEAFLCNRYEKSDIICMGETSMFVTATLGEFLKSETVTKRFSKKGKDDKSKRKISVNYKEATQLVASPMSSDYGKTKSGTSTMKSRDNCGPVKYVVFEIDDEDLKPLKSDSDKVVSEKMDKMMATAIPRIKYLAQFAPLVDIIYSGSKSPHACFDVEGFTEKERTKFLKVMMKLGADAICRLPEQFFRTGGVVRKTARGPVVQAIYAIGRSEPTLTMDLCGQDVQDLKPSKKVKEKVNDELKKVKEGKKTKLKKSKESEENKGGAKPKKTKKSKDSKTKTSKSKSKDGVSSTLDQLNAHVNQITVDNWNRMVEVLADLCHDETYDPIVVAEKLSQRSKMLSLNYTKAEMNKKLTAHSRALNKDALMNGDVPHWGRGFVFVTFDNMFYHIRSAKTYSLAGIDGFLSCQAKDAGVNESPSHHLLSIENFPKAMVSDFNPAKYNRKDPDKGMIYRGEAGVPMLNSYSEVSYPKRTRNKKKLKRAKFLIMRHLRNMFTKRDAAIMLDWLANALQNAGERMSWMPVIQSAEGAGKGLLVLLLRATSCDHHISLVSPSAFHSDYSDYNEGKTVIAYDEFNMVDKRGVSSEEDLKNAITEERLVVNRKCGKMIEVQNISKKIAFTNSVNCMELSASDRRFCMIQSIIQSEEDCLKLNKNHFREFCDEIIGFAGERGKLAGAAREFLMTHEIDGSFDPRGRAPKTRFRQELVERSRSAEYTAIKRFIDDKTCMFATESFLSLTQMAHEDASLDVRNHEVVDTLRKLGYVKFCRDEGYTNAPKDGRPTHTSPSGKQTKHILYVKKGTDFAIKTDKSGLDFSKCSLSCNVGDDFDDLTQD